MLSVTKAGVIEYDRSIKDSWILPHTLWFVCSEYSNSAFMIYGSWDNIAECAWGSFSTLEDWVTRLNSYKDWLKTLIIFSLQVWFTADSAPTTKSVNVSFIVSSVTSDLVRYFSVYNTAFRIAYSFNCHWDYKAKHNAIYFPYTF